MAHQADAATIARPYTKAAFTEALAQKALPTWATMLRVLAILVKDISLQQVIKDPRISAKAKTDMLSDLYQSISGQPSEPHSRYFIGLLAQYNRVLVLPTITQQFDYALAEYEKCLDVEIISAFALNEEQCNNLSQALQRRFQRKIRMTTRVDSTLLGGVIIRAGDTLIDGSMRGRIAQLKTSLNA